VQQISATFDQDVTDLDDVSRRELSGIDPMTTGSSGSLRALKSSARPTACRR
jgi:hypothetical protein